MIAGGTENHLLLIDSIQSFGISGGRAQEVLEDIGITLNKNAIPDDNRSPMDPSGIRIGTPALTTRGFKEEDCKQVAEIICDVLENPDSESVREAAKDRVREFIENNPIPESF